MCRRCSSSRWTRSARRRRSRRPRLLRPRALARVLRGRLGGLGLADTGRFDGERGEAIHYLRFPQPGSGSIGLRQALEEQPFELYAPGFHHLALAVESRADVDAAHAAAVEAGAEVLHAPRLRPQYHDAYYATFFLDPDGFRLEVAASRDARL